MAYSGQTTFYRLPFMRMNDYLTEAEEERRAKIIDHLLYVATYGASKAIIVCWKLYALHHVFRDFFRCYGDCKFPFGVSPGVNYCAASI